MAIYTPVFLYQNTIPVTGTVAISATNKIIIKEIILCNTSGNIVQVNIAKLLNGESVITNKNILFNNTGMTLQGYETKQITISLVLNIGDSVYLSCNSDLVVSANISGVEIT